MAAGWSGCIGGKVLAMETRKAKVHGLKLFLPNQLLQWYYLNRDPSVPYLAPRECAHANQRNSYGSNTDCFWRSGTRCLCRFVCMCPYWHWWSDRATTTKETMLIISTLPLRVKGHAYVVTRMDQIFFLVGGGLKILRHEDEENKTFHPFFLYFHFSHKFSWTIAFITIIHHAKKKKEKKKATKLMLYWQGLEMHILGKSNGCVHAFFSWFWRVHCFYCKWNIL